MIASLVALKIVCTASRTAMSTCQLFSKSAAFQIAMEEEDQEDPAFFGDIQPEVLILKMVALAI